MRKKVILIVTAVLLLALAGSVVRDVIVNGSYKKYPSKPAQSLNSAGDSILKKLENGEAVDFTELDDTFTFIENRYDCSDFRLQSLLRMMYEHPDKLDTKTAAKIKETLLGFKYWMTEPGEDSMCFWSENHQILFAASEYLAGQLYPDEIFVNDGQTGRQHMESARKRILDWLEFRWRYGFTEWYSNVYYVEDIAPMSNLIDFCKESEIVEKTKIIMDLLLYDIGSQSYKGNFITTSGRLYEKNKMSGQDASTIEITKHVFGYDPGRSRTGMEYNFITINNYKVPEVIKKIGQDEGTAEIKASNGLDLGELRSKGLYGTEDRQIMMQWGMEAFTNPEIISNSIRYINKYNLFSNEPLYDFTSVNFTVLKAFGLLPTVSRIINPQTNGVAIQRANTYTYKTGSYSMATAQKHYPGEYGDQQHIWTATLGNDLSIFTVHPAVLPKDRAPNGNSPTYWVGSGHLPHSVQSKNINMSLYILPDKKGLMEKKLLKYTHAYFPSEIFSEVIIDGNHAFGRYGDTYAAFTAKNKLYYAEGSTYDLIQDGQETYWICELGTKEEEGSFEAFVARIRSNKVTFEDSRLTYVSKGTSYRLDYKKDFYIDEKAMNLEYDRIDSPYAKVGREADTMTFEYGGSRLFLDFKNMIREEQ